jgi:hypothetical protein
MATKRRKVRVTIPRPRGTRASSRVELSITMHPRDLEELASRARSRSMSLTSYVRALLASDAEDVAPAPAPVPRFSLSALADPRQEVLKLSGF